MKNLADLFRAFGNERRLLIWKYLLEHGAVCVLDLSRVLGISEEATSKHLKKLAGAGMIRQNRRGEYVLSMTKTSQEWGVLNREFLKPVQRKKEQGNL